MSEATEISTPRRSSAWKRWAKRLGIAVVVLIAVALLAHGIMLWRAGRVIRAELQAVRAAKEPLNWDEMVRTDRQGHVQEGDRISTQSDISQIYAKALNKAAGWQKSDGLKVFTAASRGTRPVGEDLKVLADSLEKYQEALDLFRKSARYKGVAIVTETTRQDVSKLLPQLSLLRAAARMLSARALCAAAQGRGAEAADWCIVLCRFARAFPGENLISGLVSIAVQHVALHTIKQCQEWAPSSSAKTRELIGALADLETDTPLVRVLCGERVYGSHLFQSSDTVLGSTPRLFKRTHYAEYLKLTRRTIAVARKPFPSSVKEMEEIVRGYARPTFSNALTRLLVPALASSFLQAGRQQAELRILLISLGVRRARLDGKPFPAKLEDLLPKYLDKLPLDPFTAAPLLYRVDDDGCLIYSVGDDGQDNGGTELTADKIKYQRGTDIVIRLAR